MIEAVWPRWIVTGALAAGLLAMFYRGRISAFPIERRGESATTAVSALLGLILMGANFAWMGRSARPPALLEIGAIAAYLAGAALWVWGRFAIGDSFAQAPAIRERHVLATSGPFAFVRNPLYAGNLVMLSAHSLATGVYWTLPLAAVVLALCLVRIRAEEALLREAFGDAYARYARRTARLLPGVY